MTKSKAHFIGIGGIGISALARYFLAQNWLVSGSDVSETKESIEIAKDGAKVEIGHKKSNITRDLDLVVYSQAIPQNNIEISEAKRLKIPVKTYPEALGELTKKYKTLAVAGSHGKSTTTALLSLIFLEAKLDPTVIIGTKLKEFGGRNFRLGKSEYLIIEADEYKCSFLNYYPAGAIITNVDREHLDHYKNFGGVKKGFLKFIGNLLPGGVIVLNKDDKPLFSFGQSGLPAGRQVWYSLQDEKHVKQIKKVLQIFGSHNVSNALAAYSLAKSFGIKEKVILRALRKYQGAWRRMEYKGKFQIPNSRFQILVYDDYAHHPTEICATLKGIAEKFPKSQLVCVFQPHQTARLKLLFKEFTESFDAADTLILLDVYKVKGRDSSTSPKTDKVSHNMVCCDRDTLCRKNRQRFCDAKNIVAKSLSETLANSIVKRKTVLKVIYLPRREKLLQTILSSLDTDNKKSAVVVMMGAGDIINLTPGLLK